MSLNKLLIATALMVSFAGVALADDAAAPVTSGTTTSAPAKHKAHHKAHKAHKAHKKAKKAEKAEDAATSGK